MKHVIVAAVLIVSVLACSLLPGVLFASWQANRGYPILGVPLLVAMSPVRWSVNFYGNATSTAGPLLIITVHKP